MSSALIIIDVQKIWAESNPGVTARIDAAATALRQAMPVIWVCMNKEGDALPVCQATKGRLAKVFDVCSGGYELALQPARSDFILTKLTPNGFAVTNLEEFLRAENIKDLYFAGFMASQCVIRTAQGAAMRDFNAHIMMDLVADGEDTIFHLGQGYDRISSHLGVRFIQSHDMGLNLS